MKLAARMKAFSTSIFSEYQSIKNKNAAKKMI